VIEYLLNAFDGEGAFFMWAITAVLAFGIAVVIERIWTTRTRLNADVEAVHRALDSGDLTALATSARQGTPMHALIGAAHAASDVDAAWDAMGAVVARAEPEIHKNIPYLATIGNLATMIGLLGTVYGLILAFSALGDTSAGERAMQLSEGISTAMATTAYGLLVGIPALAVHTWLDSRAQNIASQLEAVAGRLALAKRA
jgi:biopolymer transport protein ExbB